MFAIGDQLPMFVDVAELAHAIDEGRVDSFDVARDDVDAHAMFDRKAKESAEATYEQELEDAPPTVIGINGAAFGKRPEIADGHHRLASWAARGQLAPITFTDDIDEVYESLDKGPCYDEE